MSQIVQNSQLKSNKYPIVPIKEIEDYLSNIELTSDSYNINVNIAYIRRIMYEMYGLGYNNGYNKGYEDGQPYPDNNY